MRRLAARAMRAGGPDVVELGWEDLAPLARGEALVQVEAAGLNHAEALIRSGTYAVFDPVGAATYETSLQLLAPRGYLVNYGQLSGELPAIDLGRLMDAGSVFVTKYGPRAGLVGAQHLSALISETLALAATCPVASDVAARVPLDRVVEAYRLLESNPHGKVLVMPQWHAEHGGSLSP
jgi:NADPH2:quinone reductase